MESKSIGFIGGGRITKIMLHGFKNLDVKFSKVVIFDINQENLSKLHNVYPDILVENNNIEAAATCDVVFVALHPPIVLETLSKIEPFVNEKTMLVSLAPKITIEKIKSNLKKVRAIARVNPSAAGIINQGMNPVAFSYETEDEQKEQLLGLLKALGKAPEVSETKIEAYAVICAMGSTYFWFQLKMLEDLGLQFGMDVDEVKEVISEMMRGTVNTLFYSKIPSEEVMDLVPVKPIGEYEEMINSFYMDKLNGIYDRIKP